MHPRGTGRAVRVFIVACLSLFHLPPDAHAINQDDRITTWWLVRSQFWVLISWLQ